MQREKDYEKFGFKKLMVDNWLQPDKISSFYVKISDNGQFIPISGGVGKE